MLARIYIWVGLIFVYWLNIPSSFSAQIEDSKVSGTLIMALGNSYGAVLMTDSMQTRGGRQLPEPGQKLLRFDSKTAFAIAGLGKADVPAVPELSTEILGVIKTLAGC